MGGTVFIDYDLNIHFLFQTCFLSAKTVYAETPYKKINISELRPIKYYPKCTMCTYLRTTDILI